MHWLAIVIIIIIVVVWVLPALGVHILGNKDSESTDTPPPANNSAPPTNSGIVPPANNSTPTTVPTPVSLTPVPIALPTPVPNYMPISNYNYPSNTLSTVTASSLDDCATKCKGNAACIAGIYSQSNGQCALKSSLSAGGPSTGTNVALLIPSTAPVATNKYTAEVGVDYPGWDIAYIGSPFYSCAAECDKNASCKGWMPQLENGSNCWLKYYVPASGGAPQPNRITYRKS